MATKLGKALLGRTRAYRDVDVLLDRGIMPEREKLLVTLQQAVRARNSDAGDPDERFGQDPVAEAQAALDAFEEEHADASVTIRVYELSNADWQSIKARNPVPKDDAERTLEDKQNGYQVLGAVVDALEASAVILDGDDEQTPDPDEWNAFFDVVNRGDFVRIAGAVLRVNERDGAQAVQGYVAAKKA